MQRSRHVLAGTLGAILLGLAGVVIADEAPRMVRVEDAWSRATPPGTDVGAGYFDLVNAGARADRLVAAESPRAARVTIHRTIESGGTTRMEHQDAGVPIPPGTRVTFAPGGYHLMLMQLDRPLEEGETVPVTLQFERAGRVDIALQVRGLAAGAGD